MIEINKIDNDGYIIIKNFFENNEIINFNNELNQLIIELSNKFNCEPTIDDLFKIGGDFRKNLYNQLSTISSLIDINIKLKNFFINDLKYFVVGMRPGIRVDIEGEDYLTPPHQDIYSITSLKSHRCWIPTRKVDKNSGTMALYKSSHNKGLITNLIGNDKYRSVPSEILNKYQKICVDANINDIVIFNPLLIHESVKSNNKKTRITIAYDIQDLSTLRNLNDDYPEKIIIENRKNARKY